MGIIETPRKNTVSPNSSTCCATTAKRDNQGKLQWSQIDFSLMEDMVRALEYGAAKYGRNNWRKGHPITDIADSVLRHLTAFLSGEDNDPESGCSHIGHIQANAMFLMNVMKNKPSLDNRYKQKKDDCERKD